jgi:hypothetical protein
MSRVQCDEDQARLILIRGIAESLPEAVERELRLIEVLVCPVQHLAARQPGSGVSGFTFRCRWLATFIWEATGSQ